MFVVLLLILGGGSVAGCSNNDSRFRGNHLSYHQAGAPFTPDLLFGRDRSTAFATRIGRSDWPSTVSHLPTVEETDYAEFYLDIQGNAQYDRNYPRRTFSSYRVGTQIR